MKKNFPLWYKNHSHLERHTNRHDTGFVNCGHKGLPAQGFPLHPTPVHPTSSSLGCLH